MEIRAKKSLGQNFLKDEDVLNKIVNSVEVLPHDLIIEIGPGKGALTSKLKCFKCDLIAFEIDERMKPILSKLEDENTKVVYEDFLKIDLKSIIKSSYNNIHVVANIPYYITNPIINKLISSTIPIKDITLMVQNEVADRLTSNPGSKAYGSLTVFTNLKYDSKKLFVVPKTCFDPIPKVDSAVIKLVRNEDKYHINDFKKFESLIYDSFMNKRKTLRNNLKSYDWNKVSRILNQHGLNEMVRAEQISIELFVEISNEM